MSYEQIKDLRPTDFKRYCVVEPDTFRRVVELVFNRLTKKRLKAGRPPKLSVEDQVRVDRRAKAKQSGIGTPPSRGRARDSHRENIPHPGRALSQPEAAFLVTFQLDCRAVQL
jgi:hypothetical protein